MSEADLRALLLGELPEPLARSVSLHLESCAECEAAARRLDSVTDEFVRALRRVVPPLGGYEAPVAPTEPAMISSIDPARRVADYRLLEELGRGGMSVVYKARQAHPDRLVALKMIVAGPHTSPERRARFLAEADIIARLRHPQIVQIYEAGQHDGLPFLSLELMRGGSLARRLGGLPQPPREAAALVERLARAVEHAHAQGVVHRDLKPANILLTEEGETKLADFGLAKFADHGLTISGAILGTPAYMAPEQAAGDNRAVGPAADIYALGAILYELLTGRPPFQAATPLETLEQTLSQDPVPPNQLQGRLPRDLSTICLKCLEKEPARRYPAAGELADDLHRFQANRPIRARPTSARERFGRWCRRNPLVAALVGSVGALLALVVVVTTILAVWLRAEVNRANRAVHVVHQKLFQSSVAESQASRSSGRIGQRFRSLEALGEAVSAGRSLGLDRSALLDVRSQAVASLALVDLRVVRQWPIESPHRNVRVDLDGSLALYATSDDRGVVRVRRAGGDQVVAVLPAPRLIAERVGTLFSPDSRFLAVNYGWGDGHGASFVWDLRRGRTVREFEERERVAVVGFTPDSRSFVTSRTKGGMRLHNLFDPRERSLQTGASGDQVAFRPDSRQMACAGERPFNVRIVDLDKGEVLRSLAVPAETWALAWSPDGRLLAAGCNDRKVHLWDALDWHRQATLEGHQTPAMALVFSPDSQMIASSSDDGMTRLWDPVSGTPLVSGPGRCVRFDRDGRRLAVHEGLRLGIWEVAPGRECRQIRYGRLGNQMPAFSIASVEALDFGWDGRLLAAAGNDGVRFWDVATGADVGFLPLGRHETVFFDARAARLFTYGRTGLRIWPVASADPARAPAVVRVGPPRRLDVPFNHRWLTARLDRDGGLLAAVEAEGKRVLLLDPSRSSERSVPTNDWIVTSLDLSPDGRWLALDCAGIGLRLWDIANHRPLTPLPAPMDEAGEVIAEFSPDGQWLVVSRHHDYCIWRVGSWQEPPRIIPKENSGLLVGPLAFAPDGRVLAIARTSVEIQLVDLATLAEIARLVAPDARFVDRLRFSPDGSHLAAATQNRVILLWDLRALGEGLRRIGLDWELPRFPSSPWPSAAVPPENLQLALFPDRIEAENLNLIEAKGCDWDMRDTSLRGPGAWSNDRELFGNTERDGYLELEVDVPEPGRYTLGIVFTKAPDCGRIVVSLDGENLAEPFDGFHERVVRSETIDFGTIALEAGRHRVRFTAIDKNPKATHHHLAVDCLELLPAGGRE